MHKTLCKFQAVCCSDGKHCCSHGYTCDTKTAKCVRGNDVTDWLEKLVAIKSSVSNITCQDNQSVCPAGNTCCKLASGNWGCCPRPNVSLYVQNTLIFPPCPSTTLSCPSSLPFSCTLHKCSCALVDCLIIMLSNTKVEKMRLFRTIFKVGTVHVLILAQPNLAELGKNY